jgi:hypothetical protein
MRLSQVVVVLMTGLSLAGLLWSDSLYPSKEMIQSFLANDVVNLIIGLPILLGSLWLTRRGLLVGLLLWPGALLYVLYNYTAILFGVPFTWITAVYLVLVLLCAYLVFDLLNCIDTNVVKQRLDGKVPVRISAWILVLFAILFVVRAINIVASARTGLPLTELGLLIADLVLSFIWIAGGVLLLQRHPLGYTSGLGLLFGPSMLFIGLIVVLFLQPVLTGGSLPLTDVIVVALMGMICFIPMGLFLRGVISSTNDSAPPPVR